MENNDNLRRLTKGLDLYRFAYNDSFFFYDAPEGAHLPSGKHDVYLEAIIGATFYDMGFERCRRWVREKLFPPLFDLRKYPE